MAGTVVIAGTVNTWTDKPAEDGGSLSQGGLGSDTPDLDFEAAVVADRDFTQELNLFLEGVCREQALSPRECLMRLRFQIDSMLTQCAGTNG
jgi:hypothetical protein